MKPMTQSDALMVNKQALQYCREPDGEECKEKRESGVWVTAE